MNWEEIENQFENYVLIKEDNLNNDISFRQLDTSVWRRIEYRIFKRKSIISYWITAAACIGVMLFLSSIYAINVRQKNAQMLVLQKELIGVKKAKIDLNKQIQQMQHKLEIVGLTPPVVKTYYKTRIIYKTQFINNSLGKNSELGVLTGDKDNNYFTDSIAGIYEPEKTAIRYNITYMEKDSTNPESRRYWKMSVVYQ